MVLLRLLTNSVVETASTRAAGRAFTSVKDLPEVASEKRKKRGGVREEGRRKQCKKKEVRGWPSQTRR